MSPLLQAEERTKPVMRLQSQFVLWLKPTQSYLSVIHNHVI